MGIKVIGRVDFLVVGDDVAIHPVQLSMLHGDQYYKVCRPFPMGKLTDHVH